MSLSLTENECVQDVLEQMISGTDWEGEVIDDTVTYLEYNPHPEELDLLFVRAAPLLARYYADPDWRVDHEDWHYWTPQLVAGELDLNRLPEGPVRSLAKELYYGGQK
jgi:hypothetical protein